MSRASTGTTSTVADPNTPTSTSASPVPEPPSDAEHPGQPDPDTPEFVDGAWQRPVWRAWHLSFLLVVVVSVLLLTTRVTPWWVYAALAALTVAYFTLLVPAMQSRNGRPQPGARARLYLVVAATVCVVVAFGSPHGLVILYTALPHMFAVLHRRSARFGAVLALSAACVLGQLVHDGMSTSHATDAVVTVCVAVLVSIAMGAFTHVMMAESERRGRLISQLTRTRAELADANHEAGVLAERARMAQEIHDTLAQGFTSLLMLVQAADAALDHDPDDARRRLQTAARTARDSLSQARALVAAQDDAALAEGELHEALGRATAAVAEECDVAAEFDVRGSTRPLPATTQVALVRAAQEALNNVRKHASADHVRVELAYQAHAVRLTVHDDGCGFEPGPPAVGGGYGLRGMRDRLRQVRGTLDIESAPATGTTVRVEVPT